MAAGLLPLVLLRAALVELIEEACLVYLAWIIKVLVLLVLLLL